jgi:asparagine synthase (glutamine-hydrolysing)
MCGIAGLVSFTRDLTDRHDLAGPMSEAMALRGPDQEGRWSDQHALLTFRRNAVIDLVGGSQPMVAEDGAGAAIAVLDYTGEIFDVTELRADLSARGHRFHSHSDTEVVLRAYLEWGEECAGRLRGMFAFAVWDVTQTRLVLIRDRIGIYPLFYTEVSDGLLFGSEPKALFASGLCEPVVDQTGLREVFGFTPTPGLSVFRGVHEVIPGEVVSYDPGGLRRRRYWRLPAREHTDDYDTTVRTVRAYLEDAVRSQLVSDVPLCAMLSGGLDSSAMCALVTAFGGRRPATADQSLPDGRLRTYSMEFAYHLTNFQPNRLQPAPDSPYAQLMSEHLGTVHQELLLTAEEAANSADQSAVLAAMDRPVARLDMYVAMRRLSATIKETSKVALSGDGADELFGGYAWSHDPSDVAAETFPWFGSSYRFDMFSGLLDRRLLKELDLPGYSRDRYAEALAEVPHVDGAAAHERRMRELTYLHMTRYLRVIIDRKDRMGMAVALEGRVPFCDHQLVEYVFNVPWAMKSADGREKSLLRAAVADLLPADIRDRRKSLFPTLQDPAYAAALRGRLRELVEDASSPIAWLLDPARLRAVLTGEAIRTNPYGAASEGVNRLSIETAIMLDLWVREHGVTLAV